MKSKFDPQKHHRRSIRLKSYDYASEGAYYVTIVTYERECLFGEIIDNGMYLSTYGEIVQKWWKEIPERILATGREDPAPTQTNIGTNCCLLQISIHEGYE